jgi:bifunctional NMN adenylyltransferase/nudix hydrolase
MGKAKHCVFIGRFQPLHNAHLKIIENALEEEAERLIIVVGSYRAPKTPKNPWSFQERKAMIEASLSDDYLSRTTIVSARDYLYSNVTWLTGIQNAISQVVDEKDSVKIIGHWKDNSSFYLKLFPQWTLIQQPNYFGANSTDMRSALFNPGGTLDALSSITPGAVREALDLYKSTDEFERQRAEYTFVKNYRSRWKDSPYEPVFITTDAIVVQAGHVLLIKRKLNPGKGMFALPGGFIKPDELIENSCLRELKEETKIVFPKDDIRKSLRETHVFDHPYRDPRGRFVTHGHYFRIDELGPLPNVEGGDDAAEALWMPLSDLALYEENFYSDHLHIVNYFVANVGR